MSLLLSATTPPNPLTATKVFWPVLISVSFISILEIVSDNFCEVSTTFSLAELKKLCEVSTTFSLAVLKKLETELKNPVSLVFSLPFVIISELSLIFI